ncbi:hypothetical protein SKAU_G00108670 [Synaphobranchus kaupii]|uniref:TIR domain-containing protein n=1 Tax=Synaphobranchus kaupii TaxID=118154 RepID=A0A9Q1FZP6_SYNKA|nr:hypothetical protein SKAU_G00108670 [Synaphobranchus kaupii]
MQIDPEAFTSLKNLTWLFLAGNSLIQVPALPSHLQVLGMEYNKLFNITEPLGTPHLKQLLLSKNCYYANPCNHSFFIARRVFEELENLLNLTLGFNNITEVPSGLPRSLESLDLRENKISEIKELAFANVSKLRYLNLEWNCQRCDHAAQPCFPCTNNTPIMLSTRSFRYQLQINSLSLRGNSLKQLPVDLFSNLLSLKYLDLSDNLLANEIRNGTFFKALKNVTTLNLIYNYEPLKTFTDLSLSPHFSEMISLKNLFLSMGHRFEFIQNLASLEALSLADNNIGRRISTELLSSSLNYLFFAGNRLDIMWDTSDDQYIHFFKNLTNLTYLDISRNGLIYFSPEALSNLPENLRTLKASDNKLKYFPWGNLTVLINLYYLNLSRNSLTRLPSDVIKFSPNLTFLDLSHNRISQLPEGFFQAATSLRNLFLNNNRLMLLDVQFNSRLQKVTLHDNPFVCSCDTAWLSDFLRTSPIHIPKLTTNFKCGFPESLQGKSVLQMDPESCQDFFGSIGFLCTSLLTIVLTLVPLLKRLYGWDLWYCIQIFWAGHKGYSMLQNSSSQHDAFVAFDPRNVHVRDWVYNELVVNLEDKGIRRFRLCLEERDWVPGIACIENLHSAIYKSQKTVFVLTSNGFVNGTLKQAFYMVQQRLLDEKVDAVVLVLLDEAFQKLKYIKMRKRLCRKSVLSWPRNPHAHQNFWNNMRAALAADNNRSYDKNMNEGFISTELI